MINQQGETLKIKITDDFGNELKSFDNVQDYQRDCIGLSPIAREYTYVTIFYVLNGVERRATEEEIDELFGDFE